MTLSPTFYLLLAPLFWSTNFLLGKTLAGVIPPSSLTLLRWIIALLILLPFNWPKLKMDYKSYLKAWPLLLLLGITGYCLNSLAVLLALNFTTAINASFITSFNPIIFAFLAFLFYREKLTPIQGLGIVVSLLGVLSLIFQGNLQNILKLHFNVGDGIMLISVASFAIHSLILKKKSSSFPKESMLSFLLLAGIVTTFPFFIVENFYYGWGWIKLINSQLLLSILGLGLFPSLLSFYCWNKGLDEVTPSHAAIYLNLIPVFTTFFSILLLGEHLRLFQIVGGLLIFTGVVLVNNSYVVEQRIQKLALMHSK